MQKKTKRNALIGAATAISVAAVTALVNFYPVLSMKPVKTGGIDETEIISVKNGINSMFFIKSDSGYTAIDAGTKKDAVAKTLEELSIDPSEVRHLLLTHSDSDHVGSVALFANAQVHMSEDELQMVNGGTKRGRSKYNSLPSEVDISNIELLGDGQEMNIDGLIVKCIKSPGHTPGSMSYLVDGKYLFTGDAVRISGGRLLVHPFTMDESEAQKSARKLKEAKDESSLLITAHYGYYASVDLE